MNFVQEQLKYTTQYTHYNLQPVRPIRTDQNSATNFQKFPNLFKTSLWQLQTSQFLYQRSNTDKSHLHILSFQCKLSFYGFYTVFFDI